MVLPAILIPTICAIFVLVLILILFNFGARLIPTSPCSRPRLNLRGKTVLLTGASSGIGREMARILHSKGAKLILASRSTDKLEKLCQELADQEPQSNQKYAPLFKPKYCRLDLEEIAKGKEELENFMATNLRPLLSSSNQQIDVLINNAGQMAYGRAMDTEMAVLRRILDVNFVAHAALTQAIWSNIPVDGAIVVLGSIAGRVALPYMSAYSAAKHAIQAFFDSLRTEDPRPRLQILMVSAGYVNTDLGPNALNANGTPIGCRDPGQVGGMSPEYAAKEIVAALEARQTELLLAPFLPRFLLSLRLFTPNLLWFFLHRNLRTIYGNFGMKSTAE